jgi:hypothetical protein
MLAKASIDRNDERNETPVFRVKLLGPRVEGHNGSSSLQAPAIAMADIENGSRPKNDRSKAN